MAKTFRLNIITPNREFFSGDAESLVINTPDGERGILCNALPAIIVLKSGVLRICCKGRRMEAANSDGFLYIMPNTVTVLAETCVWPHEVDAYELNEEINKIKESEQKAKSVYEYKLVKAQLAAQFAKLKIKNNEDNR